ncbi:MAG: DUF3783 domain-containing protein [Desulfobacteraceae bacterium]|nr:DUF3783 domain-containing protein [Desulfobacteraceae bacterium]MBC2755959.1 DUF3783 domain-containing protein [Desulfobacteraceae bacterium]
MSHSLKVVGESQKRMYGPRGILVCGFSSDERKAILKMFNNKKFKNLPVIFTANEDKMELMKDMIKRAHQTGLDSKCRMERAIIMSGLTEKEFHRTMSAYKKLKLPKPLWATLTPTSENWTVDALISELSSERLHLEK